MQFPLDIAFKIFAITPQMYVHDAAGQPLGYVRRKLLALKESVTIFTDETQSTPIYRIDADRVIDFSASYHFADAAGRSLGYVRRKGMRSLWKAYYIVHVGEQPVFEVHEQSALVRFLDNLVGNIPLINLFTGYVLNPTYIVSRIGGGEVLRMVKRPSLLETHFGINQSGPLSPSEQVCGLLGLMMIILMERTRG